ncbi:MAG TPA: histone deacetylase [Nitrospiria bacterium]
MVEKIKGEKTQTGFITHPIYLQHDTGFSHPERPDRLKAILSRLEKNGVLKHLIQVNPEPASLKWVEEVHTPQHVNLIRVSASGKGIHYMDPDTPVSPNSFNAALVAAGGLLGAVDGVMKGQYRNAFCAVRPPGHHAESQRAMGFCLFNNVAVAARYIQKQYELERVAIIDWDVHHGNGTQYIFYDDPTVLYISTHQFPLYPGTGREEEEGLGEGKGFTLNCPMEAGLGDKEYETVFDRIILPKLETFRPQFILISAGFDAHRGDPLAGMNVSSNGFGRFTQSVVGVANSLCEGRIVSCLEGGYDLHALAESVERHIMKLMETK